MGDRYVIALCAGIAYLIVVWAMLRTFTDWVLRKWDRRMGGK